MKHVQITELSLDKDFITEEYPILQKGERVEDWTAFQIMDHAVIDKSSAWNEAVTYNLWSKVHSGQTKTNTLWWIATRPGITEEYAQNNESQDSALFL